MVRPEIFVYALDIATKQALMRDRHAVVSDFIVLKTTNGSNASLAGTHETDAVEVGYFAESPVSLVRFQPSPQWGW